MIKVVLATHNQNKVYEFSKILSGYNLDFSSCLDMNFAEIEEDQETFSGNALKKASSVSKQLWLPSLADDSGLVVPALNNEPGVYSARYAPTNQERINKVVTKMRGVTDRRAYFCCALAVALPSGWTACVEGGVFGTISYEPLGEGGFGYDPIFIPKGYKKSFAQISAEEKNRISHRHNAFLELKRQGVLEQFIKKSEVFFDNR